MSKFICQEFNRLSWSDSAFKLHLQVRLGVQLPLWTSRDIVRISVLPVGWHASIVAVTKSDTLRLMENQIWEFWAALASFPFMRRFWNTPRLRNIFYHHFCFVCFDFQQHRPKPESLDFDNSPNATHQKGLSYSSRFSRPGSLLIVTQSAGEGLTQIHWHFSMCRRSFWYWHQTLITHRHRYVYVYTCVCVYVYTVYICIPIYGIMWFNMCFIHIYTWCIDLQLEAQKL